jgi:hypothetical protein
MTPVIGREFAKDLQLSDLLKAEDSDELVRDLAVLSGYPTLPITPQTGS